MISFLDIEHKLITKNLVRFFELLDNKYLIYTDDEADEAGYIKLYCSKVIGNQIINIDDENEWNAIKECIKKTVKDNRDGNKLDIIDLEPRELETAILISSRPFKLQSNLVNLLSENPNYEAKEYGYTIEPELTISSPNPIFLTNDEVENEESEENEELDENIDNDTVIEEYSKEELLEKIASLEEELEQYKNKFEQIKDILA